MMSMRRMRKPLLLLSLTLLILNDHVLKGSIFSGVLTGKLSDFAGLFFFPFFIADCLRISNSRQFDWICILSALAFTALKTSLEFLTFFLGLYEGFGLRAAVVQDPTDLWALVMLPLAIAFERSHFSGNPHYGVQYESEN